MKDIKDIRGEIDSIDQELARLFRRRLEIVADVPASISYELRVYNPDGATLERFTVPKGTSGVATVRYDATAPLGERFSVVK